MSQESDDEWNSLQHEIQFDKNTDALPIGAEEIIRKLAEWSIKYKSTMQIMSQWEDGEQPMISSKRGLQVMTTMQHYRGLVLSNVTMIHGPRKVVIYRL